MQRYPDTDRLVVRLPAGAKDRLQLAALIRDATISEIVRELVVREIERTEARWTGAER